MFGNRVFKIGITKFLRENFAFAGPREIFTRIFTMIPKGLCEWEREIPEH